MEEVLSEQLKVLWDNATNWKNIVIAYEPVWALET
jgi:triosephosphate isomerase